MLNRRNKATPDKISVDLGGFSTRMFSEQAGLLLEEPSLGLLDLDHQHSDSRAVSHYGKTALELFQKGTDGKRLISPLQADSVNNVGHSPRMLSYFIQKAIKRGLIRKSPVILLALPCNIDETQVNQLRQACFTAGASRIHLVENAIATGLGVNIDINQPTASVVIDFGSRDSRLYAFANDEIVASATLACGGDSIDQQLLTGIRERFNVHISDAAAQDVKHRVGSAMPSAFKQHNRLSCQINGLELSTNQHTPFRISSDSVDTILHPCMQTLADSIQMAVLNLPASVTESLADEGLILTGGGALLAQLDQLVLTATDLPVTIANRPLTTAARGGGKMLTRIHGIRRINEPA